MIIIRMSSRTLEITTFSLIGFTFLYVALNM